MFESFKKAFKQEVKSAEILSPMKGKAIAMSEVSDPTFAGEILGPGVAIVPEEGRVISPVDGKVGVMFDTKHAVSISGPGGVEMIVHVGIDTVELKGKYFTSHKNTGDPVKAGDLLLTFDMDAIKEAGYDVTVPVVICEKGDYADIECFHGKEVEAGELIIRLKEK
ncbi:PTS sugar transporter subunit IIA [Anaerostipes sp.]|uniref:PTS sugar transporter subunit IIA n=1 Tax=Anaerostipes sp. TaxID=1872530 RepID=UPI0025C40EC3|nr:PTS glucose transporter subunit IIA [Anaerostipes sp.]MBS7008439.1 PTS glucose transporter subunit IIA [Anaerostipes sp.]